MRLVELLEPRPEPWWDLLPQIGVTGAVGLLEDGEQLRRWLKPTAGDPLGWVEADQTAPPKGERSWDEPALARLRDAFADHGLELIGLEDTPPMDLIRLGLPGRDEQIEWWIDMIRAAARVGVRTICYNWMALRGWVRTRTDLPARGGAKVSGYDHAHMEALGPVVEPGRHTHDDLWRGLEYFLAAVAPEAEAAGVALGMHPDDPPLPAIRGLPRIMGGVAAYDRLLALAPGPANGITFCQGNFSLMTDDLPGLIRRWGDHVKYVHLRDVEGSATSFQETFHDDGPTDLFDCVRAYADTGFAGPLRPDHVPTLSGEDNHRPGYMVLGRLHAIGYIEGLRDAAYR
ncbi:MAG: mannonate dehydratase [Propionibacteriaceae bacterium]|jgi:mannonate dehydratase|nr:mannonate dehydratase [Propionibacteriaceae bacterium]